MRYPFPLVAILLGASLAHSAQTSTSVLWSDNFNALRPLTDNSGTTLPFGSVLQIGIFDGVDPNKDPRTYTAADWATFTPLTGEGSLNPTAFPDSFVGSGSGFPPGFFSFGVTLNTDSHLGIPAGPARVGIRFYDATTVVGSTRHNTVSAADPAWILPIAAEPPNVPTPPLASMDSADTAGTLAWQGTPFRTSVLPQVVVPDLVLTDFTLVNPTTLRVSWTGGDGSNDIQTSPTGQGFVTVASGQSSPATITINSTTNPILLIRVIEP